MNPVQLGIIIFVGALIVILIGYFWYQEVKFKKMVEHNFNHKTEDVINEEQTLVLDGIDISNKSARDKKNVLERDISHHSDVQSSVDRLFNGGVNPITADTNITQRQEEVVEESFPEDSVEAIFANIKKIPFPFEAEVDFSFDYIVNIAFEEAIKIKVLPDIASLTQKQFKIYVLDGNNQWLAYVKGNKYIVQALKVVVHLVDKNGIISQAQVANVYNELFKFVMHHKGFIEQSNFEASIIGIREQIKHLSDLKLNLELFLILKKPADYGSLTNFFMRNNFTEIGGEFNYIQNGVTQFIIGDEHNNGLRKNGNYSLLRIVSNLHFIPDPMQAVENILDIAEKFMQVFESRLLTTNKQVFNEREYNSLTRYINNYVNNAKKHGVQLGGELVRRLL